LIGLGLKSCSAQLDRSLFFEALEKEKTLKREYSAAHAVTDSSEHHFDAEGTYHVAIADSKGRMPLTVECTFELHMHSKLATEPRFLNRFSKSELPLIVVPFARQIILDLTGRMAVPPVIIPLSTRKR
jgi:preprotein translocase subunit SecB